MRSVRVRQIGCAIAAVSAQSCRCSEVSMASRVGAALRAWRAARMRPCSRSRRGTCTRTRRRGSSSLRSWSSSRSRSSRRRNRQARYPIGTRSAPMTDPLAPQRPRGSLMRARSRLYYRSRHRLSARRCGRRCLPARTVERWAYPRSRLPWRRPHRHPRGAARRHTPGCASVRELLDGPEDA